MFFHLDTCAVLRHNPRLDCGLVCRRKRKSGHSVARTIGKLTALKIEKAKRPGMYGDGGGLYLRVTDDGAKNWVKTNPGKAWFAYFRFYAPTEAYFDNSWQLNDIEPVK